MCDPVCSEQINALGLCCPEPLMLMHQALNRMEAGECIRIVGDDPASERDIRKLCHFLKHRIVRCELTDGVFTCVVEKKT